MKLKEYVLQLILSALEDDGTLDLPDYTEVDLASSEGGYLSKIFSEDNDYTQQDLDNIELWSDDEFILDDTCKDSKGN